MQQRRKQRKDLTQRTHQTGLHPIKLLALLGKTWLRQDLWNVLMGHILDPRRVTGDSKKTLLLSLIIKWGDNWARLVCYIPRKLHEISNHHTDAYLSWKELATHLQLWKTIPIPSELQETSIFQTGAGLIIRYVHTDERKKTNVQESFVGFVAVKDTTGQGLAEKLIEVIEKN